MLKVTKISATALMFYILFYLQVWGDNHIILYGTALITVLSMAVYCFQQGYLDFSNVPFGIWNNLIMVAYSLITGVFVAYNIDAMISSCVTFAAFSIICVAICYASSEEGSFEWVLKVLIALALVCAVYALFRGVYWVGYGRTLSSTNNPHVFAAVMNLGIFSAAFLRRKERIISLFSVLLILFFFYSIIECGSRKYLIASFFLTILWLYASFKDQWIKSNNQQKVMWFFLGAAFLLLGVYLFRRIYSQSDLYLRMQETDDMGNKNRIKMYLEAWGIFLEHPIFGGGYDQYKYLGGTGGYSHSTYAEAIADFGFVGCVLYFSPIFYTSYQIMKRALSAERNYTALSLAALCISELFLGVGTIFFMEFFHFLAWTILFYYSKDREPREKALSSQYKYIRAA